MIAVGDEAPDFTLKDQNNEEFTLSSHRGTQAVLLVFYPLAFTGICTGELCEVRDDMPTFENDEVLTVSISVDSVYAHKLFAERAGYEFPLLADFWPHGRTAQTHGVFTDAAGPADRGTIRAATDAPARGAGSAGTQAGNRLRAVGGHDVATQSTRSAGAGPRVARRCPAQTRSCTAWVPRSVQASCWIASSERANSKT